MQYMYVTLYMNNNSLFCPYRVQKDSRFFYNASLTFPRTPLRLSLALFLSPPLHSFISKRSFTLLALLSLPLPPSPTSFSISFSLSLPPSSSLFHPLSHTAPLSSLSYRSVLSSPTHIRRP